MSIPRNQIPEGHILTYSGLLFNYLEPTVEMININDIAVGLSREFRFGNQTPEPFTVAQHSVIVSQLVPDKYSLEGLLHDAPEAYMKDLPAPLKINFPEYTKVENRIMEVIAKAFNLSYPFHKSIKEADIVSLEREWQCLFIEKKSNYCWSTGLSRSEFINRFRQLDCYKSNDF
jgi:hypothetical protein